MARVLSKSKTASPKSKTRVAICTFCRGANEVSARAMSVFCAHCRQRLILEDLVIKSYQGLRSYATCGDVVVEKSGRIIASIHANNLAIRGHVEGAVNAVGAVEVAPKATLVGPVQAVALKVENGGQFEGFCHIGPLPEDAAPKPAQARTKTVTPKPATPPDKATASPKRSATVAKGAPPGRGARGSGDAKSSKHTAKTATPLRKNGASQSGNPSRSAGPKTPPSGIKAISTRRRTDRS